MAMLRGSRVAFWLVVSVGMAWAQTPSAPANPAGMAAPAGTAAPQQPRPPRPPNPLRDPNGPGMVKATELPDGQIPPPTKDGNYIIGPTHTPAPEMAVDPSVPQGTVYEFTMESKDSKFYPGVERDTTAAPPGPPSANGPVSASRPAPYTRHVS